MQMESDTQQAHIPAEQDRDRDELELAHEAFLAEIVHLDGTTAQELLKTIAEAGAEASPTVG
jgi:hypothetical protein